MTPQSLDAALFRAAKRGDRGARDRLVERHLPTVRAVAHRYRDLGLPRDDLVQEGALGLLDAIDRFDPRRGDDFATFVRWRARRAILNALTEQARLVRLPKQVVELRRALAHVDEELAQRTGHTPSPAEVAAEAGIGVATVRRTRGVPTASVSLDARVADGAPLAAVVPDDTASDPEVEALRHERSALVLGAVRRLSPRQRHVVVRHFGIGCDRARLSDIGADLQVSPQRARALENDALATLATALEPLRDAGR